MRDTSGVHLWLALVKASHSLAAHAEESLNLSRAGLGDSDFRVLEGLLHKGVLPVSTIGPKVWLTPGSISVAVDRLETKALLLAGLLAGSSLTGSRRPLNSELSIRADYVCIRRGQARLSAPC